jgi:TatD DNase family protein
MAPLVDTHAHLDRFHRQGTLGPVLERAAAAGLRHIVAIGTDPGDWQFYVQLVASPPAVPVRLAYSIGLHPCSVNSDWHAAVAEIEGYFARTPRPVALGECGLDRFHLPKDDAAAAERMFAAQCAAFDAQLAIARRLDVPIVVHSRGALPECMAAIDHAGVDWTRVVFHCWIEGPEAIEAVRARGARGSFGGILTYKSAETVREACRVQGLVPLMLETDAPYLAPVPHRGKTNEPAWVHHTAECAAAVLGVPFDELASATTLAAEQFFGLASAGFCR